MSLTISISITEQRVNSPPPPPVSLTDSALNSRVRGFGFNPFGAQLSVDPTLWDTWEATIGSELWLRMLVLQGRREGNMLTTQYPNNVMHITKIIFIIK